MPSFDFACPICRTHLEAIAPDQLRCPNDAATFCQIDGIWRLLRPDWITEYRQFIHEYETVRRTEGYGSHTPGFYRALPFVDLDGRMADEWRVRATSFQTLLDQVITPLEVGSIVAGEQTGRSALKILDLGAGNGWLSYQLARRGHLVAAIDLLTNQSDGLGTYVQYDTPFTPIQAEFDHLPLSDHQVDLAIFNASFHYAVNYETTLSETWRVVKENGCVVILDSPVYSDPASGRQMLRERLCQFQRRYRFLSNSIHSEGFLTFARLNALAASTGTRWRIVNPAYGWRWRLQQNIARLRARREPAQFVLIVGTRSGFVRD